MIIFPLANTSKLYLIITITTIHTSIITINVEHGTVEMYLMVTYSSSSLDEEKLLLSCIGLHRTKGSKRKMKRNSSVVLKDSSKH